MKKIIYFFIVLFSSSTIFTQSLSVTFPGGSDNLKIGSTYTIKWKSSGCGPSGIKINIFKNKVDPSNFIEQLTGPNTGSKSWTISKSYVPGTYVIRVKNDDFSCYGDSKQFTISSPGTTPAVDLLEGHFNIGKVTYALSNNTITAINILVEYNAQKDFVICKSIERKCDPEFGSMKVNYTLKNWDWSGGKAVPDIKKSCTFACKMSCGTIYYPKSKLNRGSGNFVITIYPKKNNVVQGIKHQYCGLGGWAASDHLFWDNYFPEITVNLTLCVSFLDPPHSYKYKMITDSGTETLKNIKMKVVGDTSCGW